MHAEYVFASEEERLAWEEDQRQLDRMWYQSDEGHDFENDPFNNDVWQYHTIFVL